MPQGTTSEVTEAEEDEKVSTETWTEEFLPPITDDVTATELSAVRHCLKKWSGLTKSNLKKHGLTHQFKTLLDAKLGKFGVLIDSKNCALCIRHNDRCSECSLSDVRHGKACWNAQGKRSSPWDRFVFDDDPKPMLRLLKRAERHLIQIEKGTNAGH